jgi:hypothetical protein
MSMICTSIFAFHHCLPQYSTETPGSPPTVKCIFISSKGPIISNSMFSTLPRILLLLDQTHQHRVFQQTLLLQPILSSQKYHSIVSISSHRMVQPYEVKLPVIVTNGPLEPPPTLCPVALTERGKYINRGLRIEEEGFSKTHASFSASPRRKGQAVGGAQQRRPDPGNFVRRVLTRKWLKSQILTFEPREPVIVT